MPVGPVRRRAHPCRSISTIQKSFHIESLLAPEHVIHSASQFVSQSGQCFRLAMLVFQTGQVGLSLRVVAEEPYGGFRECPLQMRIADLSTGRAVNFAGRFFLRFHQTAVGHEILHAGEARDVMNLIQKHKPKNLADTGNRIEQMKAIGIVLFGMAQDFQFDLVEQVVVEADPFQIEGNVGLDAGIGEAFGNTFTVTPIGDLLSDVGKVVLVIRDLDVSQQFGPLAHQMHPAAEQVSSRTHAFRIDVSLRDHPASQQNGDLVAVNLVVLGLSAVNGFHVQGVTQNEGNIFSSAQIGKPVPGEDTFDRNDDALAEGSDRFEKRIGIGFHVAMKNDRTGLIENAHIHGSSVQIDSAIMWVLLSVKSHRASSFICRPSGTTFTSRMVDPSTKPALKGEASISITAMEPTIGAPWFRRTKR